MNFSLKYIHLLVAFLLLWCFESTVEANEINVKQLQNPSGVFAYFWRRHNRTTTLNPNSTTEQWNTTVSAQSTTLSPNATTEGRNATIVLFKSKNLRAAIQQVITITPCESTSYHPNSTTEQFNATTAAHESTSFHPQSTTEEYSTTFSVVPASTSGTTHDHHHFRKRTTRN